MSMTAKEFETKLTKLEKAVETMQFYLNNSEYTAWICWHDNMEYLCITEKKLVEHDLSFLSAWNAAHGKGSFERNRIRLLGRRW